MGVPRSRFMLFHRMVLLPPLMLLTLTCLYTSSTLSPFSNSHHLSFHQDVQCFSCDSSAFPSRTFLSLTNFPASSYIRDVVLRHNVLNLEDSRGEANTELVSRSDTNEVDSVSLTDTENVPDEIEASDEETSAGIVIRQQELFDDKAVGGESIEDEVREREDQTNASPSYEKVAQDNDRGDSAFREYVAPGDDQTENYTPSENKFDSFVPTHDNDVDDHVFEGQNVDISVQIVQDSSAAKENSEGEEEDTQASSVSADNLNVDSSVESLKVSSETMETTENSREGSGEDIGVSASEDNNVHSSVEVVEVSPESKEGSEEGRGDIGSSVVEGENVESSVEAVEVSKETKEDPEGGRQEDVQRHLTSDDNGRPDEHLHVPTEADVSATEVAPEPKVDQGTEPKITKVMKFGYQNMSKEYKVAGIAVQDLMEAITMSGLPIDNGISVTDSDVEANLLLRGGSPQGVPLAEGKSCDGRHVFVYDLPSKFNIDLVGQCDTLLHWFNFCDYFINEGMGTNVQTDVLNDKGEKVLVPDGSWFLTHQYALELIFHARLKHYPCITTDVNQADLFFVPYYAGLDVIRWHFQPNATNDRRDELTFELLSWLETQEAWTRNNGFDHVFVLGKIGWDFRRSTNSGQWGSKLLRIPSMWNPTKLLIERDPWHGSDVGVPHPTFFHPKDDGETRAWLDHVEQSERRYLVSFAGMPRPGMSGNVRGHLIQQCLDHPDDCFLLRCVNTLCMRPDSTMNLFLHSHFCMQPPGDSPTRRSVFDSLIGGCIPVLFDPYTAYYQYPWHLPQNTSSYSVFIPSNDVMSGQSDIVEILKSISPEERTAMRTRIIREIIPGLLYSQPGTKHSDFRDAFDISIDALLHRVAHMRAEMPQLMDRSAASNVQENS